MVILAYKPPNNLLNRLFTINFPFHRQLNFPNYQQNSSQLRTFTLTLPIMLWLVAASLLFASLSLQISPGTGTPPQHDGGISSSPGRSNVAHKSDAMRASSASGSKHNLDFHKNFMQRHKEEQRMNAVWEETAKTRKFLMDWEKRRTEGLD
ncbi:hypothetical protein CDD80_3986 [Ophiocordyceps camponoti-rufipedis]|uniref:Uncharacterized protein n=1 Tax=Ophiocordyceps camponoti-rufipedis TaxID=2004952 RepID=A0A2C5Z013_9HYPO|nr:hypothetical protein CDD80_3986 [Ophiocordyceps camponoti-rufipedis]